jgi:hypothetical protein
MTKTKTEKPLILFKVLHNMKSCNGGNQTWKLGEKYTAEGELKICKNGFHLTTNPQEWLRPGYSVFFAEAFGISEWQEDKCVCRSVRLLKHQNPEGVSKKALAEYQPKRDAIDAEYQPKWRAIYAEYQPKRDAIYAEYQTKRDAIDAEYQTKWRAIDAEYQPKWHAIYAEYQTKRDAIDAEQNQKLSAIIAEMARLQNKHRKET